ncbi:MAG: ATP phosphoribosyltransferase [Candidatus Limnocylindria bacterium]
MTQRPLRLALAQGALLDQTRAALDAAGLATAALADGGRRLLIQASEDIEYVLARPSDIATYVGHGAADAGIVGKDVLLESTSDVLELVDLGYGVCRFVVAAPVDDIDRSLDEYRHLGSLEVATKYPRVAAAHFERRGIQVEIIRLAGSVELAPQVGLSDWIVDLVSTGRTLRENRLAIIEEIATCTARFIANRAAYSRDRERIASLAARLQEWAMTRNQPPSASSTA